MIIFSNSSHRSSNQPYEDQDAIEFYKGDDLVNCLSFQRFLISSLVCFYIKLNTYIET